MNVKAMGVSPPKLGARECTEECPRCLRFHESREEPHGAQILAPDMCLNVYAAHPSHLHRPGGQAAPPVGDSKPSTDPPATLLPLV